MKELIETLVEEQENREPIQSKPETGSNEAVNRLESNEDEEPIQNSTEVGVSPTTIAQKHSEVTRVVKKPEVPQRDDIDPDLLADVGEQDHLSEDGPQMVKAAQAKLDR